MCSVLLLLVGSIGLAVSQAPRTITGVLGSDLNFRVEAACGSDGRYVFDVFDSKDKMIGSFQDGFQGLGDYKDRLTYDKANCTITLKNLTEQDQTTLKIKLHVNNQLTSAQIILYNIIVLEPTTIPSNTQKTDLIPEGSSLLNGSQVSPSRNLSFVSFCISLDSLVNALWTLLVWIKQGRYRLNRDAPDSMDLACKINCYWAIICEAVSIILLRCIGNLWSLLLAPIPILLLADIYSGWLLKFLKDVKINTWCKSQEEVGDISDSTKDALTPPEKVVTQSGTSEEKSEPCSQVFGDKKKPGFKKIVSKWWRLFVVVLIQILFPVSVDFLRYKTGDEGLRQESPSIIYVFISFVISLALRSLILFGTFCYKRKCKFFTLVPTENPSDVKQSPSGKDLGHSVKLETVNEHQMENQEQRGSGEQRPD